MQVFVCQEATVCCCLQFIDDVLDFTSSSGQLGKPSLNDVKSGVITAPVLYAAEQHPELKDMIQRKFKNDGDVSRAIELVFDSDGIQRTRAMAEEHCKLAARTVCQIHCGCMLGFAVELLNCVVTCRLSSFLILKVPMPRYVGKL